MHKDNRVIQRIGARELSVEEMSKVGAGIHTLTVCTFATVHGVVGDEGNSPETC